MPQGLHKPPENFDVATYWLRNTLDLFETILRSGNPTLETIQAMIISGFFLFHLEGYSTKLLSAQCAAFSIARDLGLHKVDSPANVEKSHRVDEVYKEMCRRVWWHLVGTDWYLT